LSYHADVTRPSAKAGPPSHSKRVWLVLALLLILISTITFKGAFVHWLEARHLPSLPNMQEIPPQLADRLQATDQEARNSPTSSGVLGELGKIYHANRHLPGFHERARTCYDLAVSHDPQGWEWIYYRSRIANLGGESDKEIALLASVVEINKNLLIARLRYGQLLLEAGRPDAARPVLQHALYLVIDQGKTIEADYVKLYLAETSMQMGELQRARQTLEAATEVNPTFKPFYSKLVTICQQMNDETGAKKYAKQIPKLSEPPEIPDPMQDSLALLSFERAFIADCAQSALASNRSNWAIRLLRRMAELDPSDQHAIWQLGKTLAQQGRDQEAVAALEQLAAMDNALQHPDYAVALARSLRNAEQVDEAVSVLDRYIDAHPDNALLHYEAGILELSRNRNEEARRRLEASLKFGADQVPQAHAAIGRLLARQGDYHRAVEAYRQAIVIRSDLAWRYELADLYQRAGQADSALKSYRIIAQNHPTEATAIAKAANLLIELQRDAQAIKLLDKLVALEPDVPQHHLQYARVAARLGKLESARAHCRAALRLSPQWVEAQDLMLYLGE